MNKELLKIEKQLINKYTFEKVKNFKEKYDEAIDLFAGGSEIEDKQGLEIAQMEYYQDAENLMAEIPEDYKAFREKLEDYE